MGIGLWYNPRTDKVFNFGAFDTHDNWLKNPANAKELGLRPETLQLIAGLDLSDPDSADLIRAAAVNDGIVRIRDYRNKVSVQLKARRGLRDLLFNVHKVLVRFFEPYSTVTIHNMATGEDTTLTIADMGQRLRDDSPILFREFVEGEVGDIPNDPIILKIVEDRLDKIRAKMADTESIDSISGSLGE